MSKLLIRYICFYDSINNQKENRNYSMASNNKIDYIVQVIQSLGYDVEIVSLSGTNNRSKWFEYYKGGEKVFISGCKLKLFPTIGSKNIFVRFFGRLLGNFMFFKYLLHNIKSQDKIIVYHSVAFCDNIPLLKKIKKFHLILETEEIYADVYKRESVRKKEFKLFRYANAYIFPTELLNKKINLKNAPFAINYGTYRLESDRNVSFGDDKIHVVYAGTFDPRKGGGAAAIAAAAFLPSTYHMHILGFGSEEEEKNILKAITKVNQKACCQVSYDGLLKGEEYIQFLQKCDIGLSTQNPNADFNETSFPSKVLSYLCNGLRVVSVRIKVLELSAVNDLVFYYDDDTPEAIANAIMKIDISGEYDSKYKIKELGGIFKDDINKILK